MGRKIHLPEDNELPRSHVAGMYELDEIDTGRNRRTSVIPAIPLRRVPARMLSFTKQFRGNRDAVR